MVRASIPSANRICWTVLAASISLSLSCRIGPTYSTPSTPSAPTYKELGAPDVVKEWKQAEPKDALARGKWWEVFNDRQLNYLEDQLNISNQNVAAAAANVQIARALIRQVRSQLFPLITANPSVTHSRPSTAFGQTIRVSFTDYSLPLEATWEPDLWGRVRKSVKASAYAAQASVADLESVRLSAQADLAIDYYSLRAQDDLKSVLDSTVAANRQTYELTRVLFEAGRTNDVAVAEAEAVLKASEAQAANAGVLRAQFEHAIAVLMGLPPSTFSIPVTIGRNGPPTIPVGIPSELLERRPDIAAAERAVAQANEQIGVAQTAYFPTLTLGGNAGFISTSLSNLLSWPSRFWAYGPSLLQTIYDGGLRKATVDQYEATYDLTVANYRQTVLTAIQQVEDNLAALRILAQSIAEQDAGVQAASRAVQEANARYRTGLDPYVDVLVAQLTLYNSQQNAVSYRMQQMVASVQLIKALGGGWDVSQIPSEKQLIGPGKIR